MNLDRPISALVYLVSGSCGPGSSHLGSGLSGVWFTLTEGCTVYVN